MGVVIRQSLITSVFSYLGVILGYVNLLYLFPLILNADQIGLTKIIQDIAILFVPFAQVGLSQSFIKFFPEVANSKKGLIDKQASSSFLTFMLFSVVLTYLLGLFVFFLFQDPILSLFQENSPSVIKYFHLVLILTFLLVITSILEAYSRSLLKIVVPNFIKEVLIRLLTGATVLLYFSNLIDFTQFLIGIVIVYFIALLTLVIYLISINAFRLSLDFSFLHRPLFSKILQYGLFTLIGNSSSFIVLRVDSVMVTSMLGLTSYGIYTIVFSIAVVIELPRRAVTQIITPIIAKAFNDNDLQAIAQLYRKTSINQLLIGLLLFLGLVVNLENIFYFIPNGEVFEAGKMVVYIIGIGKLLDMGAGVNSEIIVMSNYYRYNIAFIAFLAAVAIGGNYLLIPLYGLKGAAIASAFSLGVFNFIKYAFIKYKFKADPFTFDTLKALAVGILIYFIVGFIPVISNVYLDVLVRSISVTLLFIGAVLGLSISAEAVALYRQGILYLKEKI